MPSTIHSLVRGRMHAGTREAIAEPCPLQTCVASSSLTPMDMSLGSGCCARTVSREPHGAHPHTMHSCPLGSVVLP